MVRGRASTGVWRVQPGGRRSWGSTAFRRDRGGGEGRSEGDEDRAQTSGFGQLWVTSRPPDVPLSLRADPGAAARPSARASFRGCDSPAFAVLSR